MDKKIRTVFFGTSDFVISVLDRLVNDQRFEVTAVVSQMGKPQGRGLEMAKSPVTMQAEKLGLKVHTPEKIRTPEFEDWFRQQHPDIAVVASYGKIIPTNILDIPPHGFINIHPSLLPRHRGATPVPYTLLSGDAKTGVTIMRMSEGMDEGDMLVQIESGIEKDDNSQTLLPKLFQLGADALGDTIYGFIQGAIQPVPQDSTQATYSKLLDKEMGRIIWEQEDALTILRKIKAFTPWPGVYTFLEGKRCKILSADLSEQNGSEPVGTLLGASGIRTVSGLLVPKLIQLEGKKAVSFEDFLRGVQGKKLFFTTQP